MDVLAAAATLGLVPQDGIDALGTIEEEAVLAVLSELAVAHPGSEDLFAEAAARVLLARSGGVERIEPDSIFAMRRPTLEIQLRYRSEMYELFTDLAIDVALRAAADAEAATVV